MKNAEQYLAELMKAMKDLQYSEFKEPMDADAALCELLALPYKMLEEMHQNCTTTPNYWECDCEDKYINPVEGDIECEHCHLTADDSPDARLHDVLVNMRDGEYLSK